MKTIVRIDTDAIVDAYQTVGHLPYHLDFDDDGEACCPVVALYLMSQPWLALQVTEDGRRFAPDERLTLAHDANRWAAAEIAEEYLFGFVAGWRRPDVDRDVVDDDPFAQGAFDGRCAAKECRRVFGVQWW